MAAELIAPTTVTLPETSSALAVARTSWSARELRRRVDAKLFRSAVRRAVLPFALSRVGLAVVTFVAAHLGDVAASGGPAQPSPTLHDLVWRWYFWDGANYTAIATHGYSRPERIVWFPLFPLLQHLAALGTSHFFYAGLIGANIACFAACVALEMLAGAKRRGVAPMSGFLLASPFAFFLAAPYAEALFLLLVCLSLFALRRGSLGWAALAAGLATATRPTGIALLVPILYVALRESRDMDSTRLRRWTRVAFLAGLSVSGLLAFMLYCQVTRGDAFAFVSAEHLYFGHALLWPWQTVHLVVQGISATSLRPLLDVIPVGLALALLMVGARRMRVPEVLYSIGAIATVLLAPVAEGNDPLVSGGRYMLVIAPLYLLGYTTSRRSRWLGWLVVIAGASAQMLLVAFELRHGWLP